MLKFLLLAVVPLVIAVLVMAFTSHDSSRVRKLTAAQAREIIDGPGRVIVVDVREADAYDAGHIPGAVLLPLSRLSRHAPITLPDKSVPVLVYSETGSSSARAAAQLSGMGYEDVSDFGGLRSWSYDVVTTEQEESAERV